MWCNLNGVFEKEPSISIANRSFRYGDGLFESLRLFEGKVFNRTAHQKRLSYSLEVLQLTLAISVFDLLRAVELLAERNKLTSASARITLYRTEGGKYTPLSNKAAYLIEMTSMKEGSFVLNKKGLKTGVYSEHRKGLGSLSNIKSNNALLYVLAANYKQSQGLDDVLLLNEKGNLVEGSSSNLFLLKNGELVTPPLSEGPLDGTMRAWVMQHYLVEEKALSIKDLEASTEVFLTNAHGIRWVRKIGSTIFDNSFSEKILTQLNLEKDHLAY